MQRMMEYFAAKRTSLSCNLYADDVATLAQYFLAFRNSSFPTGVVLSMTDLSIYGSNIHESCGIDLELFIFRYWFFLAELFRNLMFDSVLFCLSKLNFVSSTFVFSSLWSSIPGVVEWQDPHNTWI